MPFLTKTSFLPILPLLLFLVGGVLITLSLPLFQGPDEQIHYGTIQHRAEPDVKDWPIRELEKSKNTVGDVRTYHFSEELVQSAYSSQFDELKWQKENTQSFSHTAEGISEEKIRDNTWKRYIDTYPPTASGTTSVYYFIGSALEKVLSDSSVITRFTAMRLLSVALGALIVALAYLTFRKIGLAPFQSLLVTCLVMFQPMFGMISANVNIDIMLILAFSLFVHAAISLIKDGLKSWKALLILASVILGLYSKGPGIVLAVALLPLITYLLSKHFSLSKKQLGWGIFLGLAVLIAGFSIFAQGYLGDITNIGATSVFPSPAVSLNEYAGETTDIDAFQRTHASYWGYFGWLDTKISDSILGFIWYIELLALLGVTLFLLSTTSGHVKNILTFLRISEYNARIGKLMERMVDWIQSPRPYLPERKYALFSMGMILALQLAIRFYDWRVFDATGDILIGTPGRYFLPNIIPHMLLLVTGLGYFVKNGRQFHMLLKTLAILMILLSLYSLVNVIIPRYYL